MARVNMTGSPSAIDQDSPPAAARRPPTPEIALDVPPATALLLRVMREPESVVRLAAQQLDDVLHVASQHGLLARLERELAHLGVLLELPEVARRQLANASLDADANAVVLRFEIDRVRRALADLGTRIVLLKGAAYLRAGLPPSRGRFAVDLDILVPRSDLARVEQRLLDKGWRQAAMDRYDEHYYRDWMHEIPPLVHGERETELDVHHTIFPPVSGIRIDPEALLAAATPLGDGLEMLGPADMVLHAATHLFLENPAGKLRDLLDVHDLLTLFGLHPGYWQSLIERAHHHGLGRPLYYALHYAAELLGTPVPAAVLAQTESAFAPLLPQRRMMDWLVRTSIVEPTPGRADGHSALAGSALFVRSHWIKMPPMTLLGHLVTKLVRTTRKEPD